MPNARPIYPIRHLRWYPGLCLGPLDNKGRSMFAADSEAGPALLAFAVYLSSLNVALVWKSLKTWDAKRRQLRDIQATVNRQQLVGVYWRAYTPNLHRCHPADAEFHTWSHPRCIRDGVAGGDIMRPISRQKSMYQRHHRGKHGGLRYPNRI
jgi:hypothetical protein